MERKSLGFVVVTYDRPGKRPWVGFLLGSLDEAKERRDEAERVSNAAKREDRHILAEIFEVGDG